MFSKNIIIELDKKDTLVNWECVSDFHAGNSNWNERLANSVKKRILDDPYRFTSFGGDQLDLILPGDPRWKSESVESLMSTKAEQMTFFDDFWKELFEEQIIYKKSFGMDKIWYEQWGNHEYKSRVMEEGEMKRWCNQHHTTFLGSKAFVGLDIRYKNKSLMKKTLFVNHGFGSGDAKKALENLTVNVEADVYAMGHLHQPMGIESEILFFDNKTKHWNSKPQLLINTGCFTSGIRNGTDQWFDQRNKLKTSKPGTVTVEFNAYEDKMNYHM